LGCGFDTQPSQIKGEGKNPAKKNRKKKRKSLGSTEGRTCIWARQKGAQENTEKVKKIGDNGPTTSVKFMRGASCQGEGN